MKVNASIEAEEIQPPKDTFGLVRLPYDPQIFLCPKSKTRWFLSADGELVRDLSGEKEWADMAAYVNKSYDSVFEDAIHHAKKR